MISTEDLQYVRGASRRTNSGKSRNSHYEGIKRLEEFCQQVLGHSKEEEIKLMFESQRKQEGRAYRTLDKLVNWMEETRKLRPKTISGYMSVVKGYLRYYDVRIYEEEFRWRVKMPMSYPIPDKLLTKETIQKIIQSKIDPRLRALICLLASSGIRIGEALNLRMRDLELDTSPPIISLAGQITKNGQPREAYLTKESAEMIKNLRRKPDQYIFSFMEGKEPNPNSNQVKVMGIDGYRHYMANKKANQMLGRVTKSLGLDAKIEGHPFHEIHFHTLRKYFCTTVANFVSTEYAHLLLGHKQYMGMYDLTPKEEMRKKYHEKLEKELTIGKVSSNTDDYEELKKKYDTMMTIIESLSNKVTMIKEATTKMEKINPEIQSKKEELTKTEEKIKLLRKEEDDFNDSLMAKIESTLNEEQKKEIEEWCKKEREKGR